MISKTSEIENLIDKYVSWIKDQTQINQYHNFYEISTPFLDMHNDHISIYLFKKNDEMYISDGSDTLHQLEMAGVKFSTATRKEKLKNILNAFGIDIEEKELKVKINVDNFAQKKHFFIQAILQINDMFLLSQENVKSIFVEDVEHFLTEHNVRFTEQLNLIGRSGLSHSYDFIIPKSNKRPERICKAVNLPNKENTSSILFSWNDTLKARKKESELVVFLNDKHKISREIFSAYNEYNAKTIPWSKRTSHISYLAG